MTKLVASKTVPFITTTQPGWASLRERFQNPFTAFYVHESYKEDLGSEAVYSYFGNSDHPSEVNTRKLF
jgi:hypothetical protein